MKRIIKKLSAVTLAFVMAFSMLAMIPTANIAKAAEVPVIKYKVHRQTYGWEKEYKTNGQSSGTVGESKRLESIIIEVDDENLGVEYRTHVQTYGWLDWSKEGQENGTEGEAKRLEAIQIKLTGADKDKYDIYYRVHAQTYGWLGWAKNGEPAGTAGQSKRLEAIDIVIVPAGQYPSELGYAGSLGCAYVDMAKKYSGAASSPMVEYMTHVQSYGDQVFVADGSIAGTSGESKRLESIKIKVNNENLGGVAGGIEYKTHVQTYGWQDWVKDGQAAGTSGESKRLESIMIRLYGDLAEKYDVYYRVHAQTYGWLGWVKNGEESGTAGLGKRLEAIQIVVVPKNTEAPNSLPAKEGAAGFVGTPSTQETPSTETPTTEAPSTEAPSTEAPSTEAPSTEAPSTEVPSTEAPTTEAPSTEAPTTEAPSTEEKELVAIEITMDNWDDYFEFERSLNVDKNGFGEIEYISNIYKFELKDEYVDKLAYNDNTTKISLEYTYSRDSYFVKLGETDYEKLGHICKGKDDESYVEDVEMFKFGDDGMWNLNISKSCLCGMVKEDMYKVYTGDISQGGLGWIDYEYIIENAPDGTNMVAVELCDFEVLRITGTLYIYE